MDFNIPTGRIVQGSLHKKGEKDMQGRPIPLDKQRIYFGVAVPKQSPGVLDVINALVNFAWTESANKRNAAGQAVGPTIQAAIVRVAQNMADPGYSLKIEDGDLPGEDGKLRPNLAGCYLFKFGSGELEYYKCWSYGNGQYSPVAHDAIKRGWYVTVAGSAALNKNTDHTAGMYLNPRHVVLVGTGPEISTGPTVEQSFASAPAPVLPAGATPLGAGGVPIPAAPQAAGSYPTALPIGYAAPTPPVAPSAPPISVPAMTPIVPAPVAPPYPAVLSGPPRIGG